jgi:hypothetical protein
LSWDEACPSTSQTSLLTAAGSARPASRPRWPPVAVGHRAHRLAFAMLRSQEPYDSTKWQASVAAGMTVMAKAQRGPPERRDVPAAGDKGDRKR